MITDDGLPRNTAVGDEHSDPALMEFLGAELKQETGQFFKVAERKSNQDQERKWLKSKISSGLGDSPAPAASPWQAGDQGFQGGKHQVCPVYNLLHCICSSNWFAFPMFVFLLYFCSQQKWMLQEEIYPGHPDHWHWTNFCGDPSQSSSYWVIRDSYKKVGLPGYWRCLLMIKKPYDT